MSMWSNYVYWEKKKNQTLPCIILCGEILFTGEKKQRKQNNQNKTQTKAQQKSTFNHCLNMKILCKTRKIIPRFNWLIFLQTFLVTGHSHNLLPSYHKLSPVRVSSVFSLLFWTVKLFLLKLNWIFMRNLAK